MDERVEVVKEKTNEMFKAFDTDLVRKMASLEEALENRNVNEAQLLTRIEELEAQAMERRNWLSVSKDKDYVKYYVKESCEKEVTKKLEEALPTAIQKGLRELPSEMVCAYKFQWQKSAPGTVVTYDRITSEFNNTDRPGGADGGMDIATGVFTATTSGHYIITYSLGAFVKEGEYTWLFLHHNGVAVEESEWASAGGNFLFVTVYQHTPGYQLTTSVQLGLMNWLPNTCDSVADHSFATDCLLGRT